LKCRRDDPESDSTKVPSDDICSFSTLSNLQVSGEEPENDGGKRQDDVEYLPHVSSNKLIGI
jgi:hypothetical protein